jgi:uncharacterized protein YqhQ
MRGQKATVTTVRRHNGKLASQVRAIPKFYSGRLRQSPLTRGFIALLEAMVLGIRSLLYSANTALEEEEEQISGGFVWLMVGVSVAFAFGLFFLAPLLLTNLFGSLVESSFVFHLLEGLIRLAVFVAYIWIIGQLKDIKRTFSYHGAEHKTINAYEAGVPLTVADVQRYGTAHMRCGTSFILTVLVIAILVFAVVGKVDLWLMIVSRLVLLPVIAMLGYETIRLAAAHPDNFLVKAMAGPGLFLQKLTTAEPDNGQVEVAITALEKAIAIDKGLEQIEKEQTAAEAEEVAG